MQHKKWKQNSSAKCLRRGHGVSLGPCSANWGRAWALEVRDKVCGGCSSSNWTSSLFVLTVVKWKYKRERERQQGGNGEQQGVICLWNLDKHPHSFVYQPTFRKMNRRTLSRIACFVRRQGCVLRAEDSQTVATRASWQCFA